MASTVTVMTRMSSGSGCRPAASVPVARKARTSAGNAGSVDSPPKRPGGLVLLPPPCRQHGERKEPAQPIHSSGRRRRGQAPGPEDWPGPGAGGPRRAVRRREASAGDHGPPLEGRHKQPADATSHVGGRARCPSSKATCQCQLASASEGAVRSGRTPTRTEGQDATRLAEAI